MIKLRVIPFTSESYIVQYREDKWYKWFWKSIYCCVDLSYSDFKLIRRPHWQERIFKDFDEAVKFAKSFTDINMIKKYVAQQKERYDLAEDRYIEYKKGNNKTFYT